MLTINMRNVLVLISYSPWNLILQITSNYRLADRQAMLRAAGTIIGLGAAANKGNSSCKLTFYDDLDIPTPIIKTLIEIFDY